MEYITKTLITWSNFHIIYNLRQNIYPKQSGMPYLTIPWTAHIDSSINPLHFVARTSVARLLLSGQRFVCGRVQRILRVGVSDPPFYHSIIIMCMFRKCCHGEVK